MWSTGNGRRNRVNFACWHFVISLNTDVCLSNRKFSFQSEAKSLNCKKRKNFFIEGAVMDNWECTVWGILIISPYHTHVTKRKSTIGFLLLVFIKQKCQIEKIKKKKKHILKQSTITFSPFHLFIYKHSSIYMIYKTQHTQALSKENEQKQVFPHAMSQKVFKWPGWAWLEAVQGPGAPTAPCTCRTSRAPWWSSTLSRRRH